MKINIPPHFKSLTLVNFRGFKKAVDIGLAPLTFLVGPNSAGKSSIFDAFLLVAQSGFLPAWENRTVPTWIGPLVDLGSFGDVVYGHQDRLQIGLSIEVSVDPRVAWREHRLNSSNHSTVFEFLIRRAAKDPVGYLSKIRVTDKTSGTSCLIHIYPARKKVEMDIGGSRVTLQSEAVATHGVYEQASAAIRRLKVTKRFSKRGEKSGWMRLASSLSSTAYFIYAAETQRVSSGRSAPKRWYPVTGEQKQDHWFRPLGSIFDAVDPQSVDTFLRPDQRKKTARSRKKPHFDVKDALRKLDIASDITSAKLSAYHTAINIRDSATQVTSNLIDVGYGASQVLPLLAACASGASGPLFVEQPEIHLHPKAQGVIGEILGRVSRERQVIVETHSEHLINRARIMVARGELRSCDVIINYISRGKSGPKVHSIPILENGDFGSEWPAGFFDERFEDTMSLLELKEKKG
ncbi:MAG: DUF3696 domain-containing protein [Gammaproteobacteria bacterium]|nr:DUF3696 domain-containing protein [Gammaproteobacteria bacterium]